MKKFLVMPERSRFFEVDATTAEMAFRGVCSWYSYGKTIAILDRETAETKVFIFRREVQ